jgi:phosphorylated adapter RNA export protein
MTTAMDADDDARSRLVFDDADSEIIDAVTTTPTARVGTNGFNEDFEMQTVDDDDDDVAPRVLMTETPVGDARSSAAMMKKLGGGTHGGGGLFQRFNSSLGDFFARGGSGGGKRERVASPAVKATRAKLVGGRARVLDEPKVRLLARAIDTLGEDVCRSFAEEAAEAQANGGEWTASGERKRTTGGIFWSIVRARASKEEYDVIFAEERARHKERVKARRARAYAAGKENVPPVDGVAAPTMAQILFGSIRDEHFVQSRTPLAPITMDSSMKTPKATVKAVGRTFWADDEEDEEEAAPAAPTKSAKSSDFTFAQIAARGVAPR